LLFCGVVIHYAKVEDHIVIDAKGVAALGWRRGRHKV